MGLKVLNRFGILETSKKICRGSLNGLRKIEGIPEYLWKWLWKSKLRLQRNLPIKMKV